MAGGITASGGQVSDGWAKHMTTIRRLYLDEDMTLQEVMKVMASEHGFVASVKVYKKRLRDYNCRKNIRSTESDVQAYQNISPSNQWPARIRLSNGQVVTTDVLASHMQRKMNRTRTPVMIRTPDRYYFVESACAHTRFYLLSLMPKLSLFQHAVASQAASANLKEMDPCTQKWSKFVQALDAALDISETSVHLDKAIVVMQQAPQQFSMILEHESTKIIGNLLMFLVVATPRRPGISDKELQVFLKIVKSLLNFGATVVPTADPLHHVLRSLARWDTEDMRDFARNTSATCLHGIIGQYYPPGSPDHAILFKEVIASQLSSHTAPLSQPQGATRISKYDEYLAKTTLLHSPR
ncbi:hypothetical protein N8I77_005070 [Diaporthe amygdali]|uniref:Clr5 domain-containing protein n=1 Tax=Phomopsis amygdali TaxID=1214568 RepID=A0AAD9SNM2_PHOAM|nr:hypothetical protein N8I77_005070 [Diaporthe amygdali]